MQYEEWCEEIFRKSDGKLVWESQVSDDVHELDSSIQLDYIDRALVDPEIHELFGVNQIGYGLTTLFHNLHGTSADAYQDKSLPDDRLVKAIKQLEFLYSNYFERHLPPEMDEQHLEWDKPCSLEEPMPYICKMLWDIFYLPTSMNTALALREVLEKVLYSKNEYCVYGALDGLSTMFVFDHQPEYYYIIEKWLKNPTITNPWILDWAKLIITD